MNNAEQMYAVAVMYNEMVDAANHAIDSYNYMIDMYQPGGEYMQHYVKADLSEFAPILWKMMKRMK